MRTHGLIRQSAALLRIATGLWHLRGWWSSILLYFDDGFHVHARFIRPKNPSGVMLLTLYVSCTISGDDKLPP